jgi:hypothetical protein
MTWQFITIRLLLVFGLGVEVLCCAGILAMRSTFARIHFLGPATIWARPASPRRSWSARHSHRRASRPS